MYSEISPAVHSISSLYNQQGLLRAYLPPGSFIRTPGPTGELLGKEVAVDNRGNLEDRENTGRCVDPATSFPYS